MPEEKQNQFLNRIELIGIVSSSRIAAYPGDKRHMKFSLATNYAYKCSDGSPVIETQWHNVSVWESEKTPNLDRIGKGCRVRVLGRIVYNRYTTGNGDNRIETSIVANSVEILPQDTCTVCENQESI